MAIMARALRKTVRKKHSKRSHIFGWIVVMLGILLIISNFAFDFKTIVSSLAVLAIVLSFLFEDKLNGYLACKKLLPGINHAVAVFTEAGFTTTTEIGKSEWNYDKIVGIAETKGYFVFVFSSNHAQLYDKGHLPGGSLDEFRSFIEKVTLNKIESI